MCLVVVDTKGDDSTSAAEMATKAFKVCVIGDPGVGKTTFFDYLVHNVPTALRQSERVVDIVQQIDGEKIKASFPFVCMLHFYASLST